MTVEAISRLKAPNSLDIKAGPGARQHGEWWIFSVPSWFASIYGRTSQHIEPPRGLRIDGMGDGRFDDWDCPHPCTRPEGAAALCKHCPTLDQCCECGRWIGDVTAHDDGCSA